VEPREGKGASLVLQDNLLDKLTINCFFLRFKLFSYFQEFDRMQFHLTDTGIGTKDFSASQQVLSISD
jgi:hypothetical protein